MGRIIIVEIVVQNSQKMINNGDRILVQFYSKGGFIMRGDTHDIRCNKCGRYLFTEKDTENGYRRENDNKKYIYDEIKDEFICDECRQK